MDVIGKQAPGRWARRVARASLMAAFGLAALGTVGPALAHGEEGAGPGGSATGATGSGIAVIGTGEASAPAEGATVQFILRRGEPGKGLSEGEFDPAAAIEPITEEEVAPVIEALTGAGVPEDAIEATINGNFPFGGPFSPGSAQVIALLDETMVAEVEAIVTAVVDVATESGFAFDQLGVGYTVADCAAVETAALAAAVEDGATQAQQVADVLQVDLGELHLISRQPSYGYGPAGSACETTPSFELAQTTYLPTFIPNAEPEVEIYATVNMTYGIGA